MTEPLVTVVIPHFNRARLLEQAVESVLASTYERVEVVVVDDGSDADERKSIDTLTSARVRIIERDGGVKGPSRCRNLGVDAARGDMIVFLDSDDFMAPWCIEQRLAASKKSPEADLWVFMAALFAEVPGDRDILWNKLATERDDLIRFVESDPPWHTSSPLWRKEAFVKTGGFNEKVMYGDDTDLHMRALVQGRRVSKHPNVLPDVFVRRSAEPRITSGLSNDQIASRRVRLSEGTKALRDKGATEGIQRAFRAQHFVEGEFLLFNASMPSPAIRELLHQWRATDPAGSASRRIAGFYLKAAAALRDRSYALVRIARRIAMLLLPPEYFPGGGKFSIELLSLEDSERLREALRAATGRPHCPDPVSELESRGWLDREATQDEKEVVAWLRGRRNVATILHVGIGNGYVIRELGPRVVQGLTKDGSEAELAKQLGTPTIVANKYDVASYTQRLSVPFDCIVDVNIRSYACCDLHFRRFMDRMRKSLTRNGFMVTGMRGLAYLVPTSIDELRHLCPDWTVEPRGNVIVMRPLHTAE